MAWQTIPGIIGKVYVPEPQKAGKKHPCAGCFRCQNCGSERCGMCREHEEDRTGARFRALPKEALS